MEVRVHLTFLLLLCLIVSGTYKAGIEVGRGVALSFIVFAAVALHELVRAVFSPGKREKLQRLVLLPIGGVVLGEVSERRAEKSTSLAQETRGALAGPVANLVVAAFAAVFAVLGQINIIASPYIHSGHLTRSLIWVNAGLGLLNLVPAYPLAAGRL